MTYKDYCREWLCPRVMAGWACLIVGFISVFSEHVQNDIAGFVLVGGFSLMGSKALDYGVKTFSNRKKGVGDGKEK